MMPLLGYPIFSRWLEKRTAFPRQVAKYAFRSGHWFGPWAIAYVRDRYWGLSWWNSKIIVLSPGWFQEEEVYFVEAIIGNYLAFRVICLSLMSVGQHFTGRWGGPALFALEGANIGFQIGG
jgi:hypothetical protein